MAPGFGLPFRATLPPQEGVTVTQRSSPLRRGSALLAAAAMLAGSPSSAEEEHPSLLREGGFGAAAALVSMFYGPLKLAYASSGLALGSGSFLWTWGDQEAAMAVVTMSLGGDYVITPDHLRGTDDIRFTGEPAGTTTRTTQAVSTPPP